MTAEKTKNKSPKVEQVTPNISERRYDLDFLRICAIIAVIIVHCVSFATALDRQTTNHLSWLGAITIDSFVRWCVPVFIMISGALLINKKTYIRPGAFIEKRILRLLPAIVAWPVIYQLWTASIKHQPADLTSLINGYLQGNFSAGGQLYFLFLIAGLYLLTPFISAYAQLATRKQLWMAAISTMSATTLWYSISTATFHVEPTLNIVTQGLPYVGYFMLGSLLKDTNIKQWLLPVAALIAGSLLIDVAVLKTQHTFLYNFFFSYPTIIVMLTSSAAFLVGKKAYAQIASFMINHGMSLSKFHNNITKLSGSSFGVYLIHLIVLDIIVLFLGFNRSSLKDSLILIPLVVICSWTITLVTLRIPYLRALVR